MRKLFPWRASACLCAVAAAALAGCGGVPTQPGSAQPAYPGGARGSTRIPPPAPPLLYVSDQSTGNIYVWNWNTLGAVPGDEITGLFTKPYGQCVDSQGDVYISDYATGNTLEFARGATTPRNTYAYPGAGSGAAIGCSVDSRGDLAVSYYSTSGNANAPQGELAVWPGGGGTSYQYTSTSCYNMWPPGFDHSGNLIVQGTTSSGTPEICELPAGGTSLSTLTLSGGTINSPGSVMWDGQYIALTDQKAHPFKTGIYRTTLSGTSLTVVGAETILRDTCILVHHNSMLAQPFIVGTTNTPGTSSIGTKIVGGDLTCTTGKVALWHYTGGLAPYNSATPAPLLPYGQSVSFH
ncbi:MAG TPA: hypothetical protein VKR56_14430 [Candidatus Cybelea sp.]|nr:hypothetical protein [Candidatus Cybelea sp.]